MLVGLFGFLLFFCGLFPKTIAQKIARFLYCKQRKGTMARINVILDTRFIPKDGKAPICLSVAHRGKTAFARLGLRIEPAYWDKRAGRVLSSHPHFRAYNGKIVTLLLDCEGRMLLLDNLELRKLTAAGLRDYLLSREEPKQTRRGVSLGSVVNERTQGLGNATQRGYEGMFAHFVDMLKREDIRITEVTPALCMDFQKYLKEAGMKRNSISTYMTKLRSVMNFALVRGYIEKSPFVGIRSVGMEATKKRSLPLDSLRSVLNTNSYEAKVFKLTFLLIGINFADLYDCKLSDVVHGRLEYKRKKTGRLYSIKVEKEARALIEELRGGGEYLIRGDGRSKGAAYVYITNRLHALTAGLTLYWARHSWATIASELDIPRDVIAHALGHGNNTVTDVYIDFNIKKVDEANRRVIDWVLYGKRE